MEDEKLEDIEAFNDQWFSNNSKKSSSFSNPSEDYDEDGLEEIDISHPTIGNLIQSEEEKEALYHS